MGAHPAAGLGPAEGVHSPGCPPPNAPRSSAMPADFLEHANNNHTKKGQTGLETGRSAGGLVQNVRKPSHEWGEPLPIQASGPRGARLCFAARHRALVEKKKHFFSAPHSLTLSSTGVTVHFCTAAPTTHLTLTASSWIRAGSIFLSIFSITLFQSDSHILQD